MKNVVRVIAIIIAVSTLYLAFWPVPIEPQSWKSHTQPEFTGDFSVNDKLANFEALELVGLTGPEAVIQDAAGNVYATTHEGWILRWVNDSLVPEKWVDVKGRPLGIAFDAEQNLWVANAYIGLQKITPSGEVTVELTETDGVAIRYADDLVVTPNGRIYFSDASTKFAAAEANGTLAASLLAIMEHSDDGRIIEYDPVSGASSVVMDSLTFANGVTSDEQGRFILVAETGSYRVWKYWLQGEKAGEAEVLMENLPGFPDNVHRGRNSRYWIGFTTIRAPILDELAEKPFWRKVVQRLPEFMHPKVEPYGHVIAINENGDVLHSMQDPNGAYPATTGAWESKEHLYVSSLTAPVLARYKKSALGLSD